MPSQNTLTDEAEAFRAALISWYDANARELPWRSEPSTYKTVVSEFMLQQTQVKTVLPYFAAWLSSYPDFKSLAAASEDQVLKSWEGLGYYSRARNLHKLAKDVAAIPDGELPTDAKSWLAFPGVGPYAAAAICSISFSDPSAVVDGNVVRILSRLTADETNYKNSTDAAKSYRQLVQDLLNIDRPGDHNQAMMELGATVCHKQSPNCLLCPVRPFCQGHASGVAESLPRLAKTKFEEVTLNRAWIRSAKGVLLHKIPAAAKRMKGLHELPDLAQLAIPAPQSKPQLVRKRGITKYRITERIHAIPANKLPAELPADHVWVAAEAIPDLPFSGPHRRWITELLETIE
ncbi:A/G-specific adenine glycosylase [Pelagicoccus sp. SDUM812002]|uniref:A/G-specific adenine glycosylase n=1 Tax=Pelagicoccus sp. SDUM812002 TaxID=3041266 RepID=UPI00280C8AA4|nr:A/G-specific adenine glycosylase [Pelagicoccus sp. SDUM812002]MDQ8185339.1 A/G-specific adenine glycosylase [Pelagicoccus sp. SDUM812002]